MQRLLLPRLLCVFFLWMFGLRLSGNLRCCCGCCVVGLLSTGWPALQRPVACLSCRARPVLQAASWLPISLMWASALPLRWWRAAWSGGCRCEQAAALAGVCSSAASQRQQGSRGRRASCTQPEFVITSVADFSPSPLPTVTCSFVEPLAAGSGIPEVKTYLNGGQPAGHLVTACPLLCGAVPSLQEYILALRGAEPAGVHTGRQSCSPAHLASALCCSSPAHTGHQTALLSTSPASCTAPPSLPRRAHQGAAHHRTLVNPLLFRPPHQCPLFLPCTGVHIKGLLTIRTLVTKLSGITFSIAAGLIAGALGWGHGRAGRAAGWWPFQHLSLQAALHIATAGTRRLAHCFVSPSRSHRPAPLLPAAE